MNGKFSNVPSLVKNLTPTKLIMIQKQKLIKEMVKDWLEQLIDQINQGGHGDYLFLGIFISSW